MNIFIGGLLTGVLIGITGILIGISPFGTSIERNVGLDFMFHVRGVLPPPDNVVIIAISNQTGKQLGLPQLPRDWPRSIHATLVDNLVKQGAAVIVFDIHFRQKKSPEHDLSFATSVAIAERVVLVEQVNGKQQPIYDASNKIVGLLWSEELLQPFPLLAKAANGLATFTLPKTEASVNGFWVFKESIGSAPTIPAVALQLYYARLEQFAIADLYNLSQQALQQIAAAHEKTSKADLLTQTMQAIRSVYETVNSTLDSQALDALLQTNPSLKSLYQGTGYRHLNFYGPPGTIPNIPYQAVITGSDPNLSQKSLDFNGKVVFVGYSDLYDPGQPDRFYTVFTNDYGVDLSGVEIAATAFSNLLKDQSIILPSQFQGPLLLFLFGAVAGLITFVFPAVYGISLVIILTGAYVFIAQHCFTSQGYWLPLATPVLIEMPMAIFLGLFGQYFLERKHGKHISAALHYYLPESAAKQLTQKNASHDSFNKVVYSTCFATDMAGFSRIAEKLPPGELALMLNDYFDTLAIPLNNHGVDVTEFRADAIMCAWTSKNPDFNIRMQPILAALEAADAMQAFKQRYKSFTTDLRIGLESGLVFIGHAGGGGHFVFSIVGDCANTASRIEGLNKHIGTQILATAVVVQGLQGLLLRYLGDFMFVNKSEASPIYEIISTDSNASTSQIRLCAVFADALQLFQTGEWNNARNSFNSLLEEFPDDGPAQFFLQRCILHQNGNNLPADPKIISMDVK